MTVSLDSSGASTAAHRAAREAELRNTALELVHATEWLEQPPLLLASTEIRGQWAENLLRETSDELRRLHPLLDITTREGAGPPSEALAAAVRSSTMLVIGSRGLGSIAGFIVGSVGSATIAATEHPVVLLRSRAGTSSTVGMGLTISAYAFWASLRISVPWFWPRRWPPPISTSAPPTSTPQATCPAP
ncbi:universal stress protein [Streptomyces lavendulae]|uniref:universal stress protein n=1 Tax=Streptomyces lavendulae TaxID=1914 RepID=UPI0033CBADC9